MSGKPTYEELESRIKELEKEIVTSPPLLLKDEWDIKFEDLFNINDIQRIQDEFAEATGVASIITRTDGTPITAPSNFCRLCKEIIRETDKGLANCFKSDAVIGRFNPKGPITQPCMSGGLWDAGAGITVGGRHIANWLIGQVRDELQNETKMLAYAREIGADETLVIEAFREVPSMSREKFEQIAKVLFTIANQLSTTAYQNKRQDRFIAEIKKTEGKLRESEEQLRKVYESADNIAFVITDIGGKDTKILDISPGVEKIFGYNKNEVVGKKVAIFHLPDAVENFPKMQEELSKEKKGFSGETILVRKNGTQFPALFTIHPKLDKTGKLVGTIGSSIDISQRKQVEEAIKRNESIHSKMLANIGDVIVIIDKDGINRYKSSNIEKLFGWKAEDVVGASTWENIHLDDVDAIQKFFGKLMSQPNSTGTTECRYRCKDGSYSWIEFTGTNLLHDPDINGILGNYHDITKRKKAENQLQRSVLLLNATQQLVKIGGWEIDLENQATFWTDEVYRIHDLQPDSFISGDEAIKLSMECYDSEDRPMVIEAFRKCSEEGQAYDLEFPFTTVKGRRIWIRTITNPIIENGKVVKIIGNFMDITERKQLEEQLQQTQKMESIGTLAGGIAHDFNNILFPILGHSEMLIDDMPEGSSIESSVKTIYASALRAKELVQQILTFSRQDKNEMKLMKIQPILKEALKMLRSTIPTTINIQQEIESGCGSIKADPTQIHQIIMNLTTNAFHAMENNGGTMSIILKKKQLGKLDLFSPELKPGSYVCLTVRDTGIGIQENMKAKLFDPFYTTKEKGKGTGMGLSVVHGIVTKMGGAIQLYSKPNEGTEFNVYFPAEQTAYLDQAIQSQSSIQGGNERILLVDDEKGIISMEKQMLERLGYDVTPRTSSLEALEVFKANPDKFDLLVTDLAMPNMPGDKLASELLKIKPDTRIILCTGFSEKITPESAKEFGINAVLLKPVIMRDLAQKIRKVLDYAT